MPSIAKSNDKDVLDFGLSHWGYFIPSLILSICNPCLFDHDCFLRASDVDGNGSFRLFRTFWDL